MFLRKFAITFLIASTVLYLAMMAWLYFGQRGLLYVPDTNRYHPEMAGVQGMSVVYFPTSDGLEISGWYKKAPNGRPTILYFHGNGGNNLNHAGNAQEMIDAGYGLLILEYRGYGGNPGVPSEEGLYNDGRAAIQFLKNEGAGEKDLILFGYSLGTGIAIKMATEISPKALVIQAPYSSIADVGQGRYWFMPVKLLIKDSFMAIDLINEVDVPTLYQFGTEDRVIPPKFSRKLYEADTGSKTLEVYEGYGHHDLGNPDVVAGVFRFLDQL